MKKFDGKAVVITGGNSGIGYVTAKEFIGEGAHVIITGRRQDALNRAAEEIGARAILADQANVQETEKLADSVKNLHSKIDVLFINAGVAFFAPIENTTEEQFDAMTDINFKGSFFTLQKFIPLLNDGASVIFLTSNSVAMTMPGSSVYAAGKSAMGHLARIAAKELAPRKIRVNTVNPGPTQTEMINKFGFDEATLKGMTEGILAQMPLAKIGTAEDVAKMVVYLADSNTSSFITGAEFFIDGGLSI